MNSVVRYVRMASLPSVAPIPVLEANIKSTAEIRGCVTLMVWHRVVVLLVALSVLLQATGMFQPIFEDQPTVLSGLWLALLLLGMMLLTPVVIPPILRFAMVRNVPFAAAYIGFFMVFSISEVLIYTIWGVDKHTWSNFPLVVFRRFIYVTAIHLIIFSLLQEMLRDGLGKVPDLVPLFAPVPVETETRLPAALIKDGLAGQIVWLRAANQYVTVKTDAGREHLLRMTLKQAEDMLPEAAGLRVHRSWWVSNAALKEAVICAEDRSIRLPDITIPIGKTRLQVVLAEVENLRRNPV